MTTIANGESLGPVRTKINNLITNFMEPGLTAKSLPLLLASTAFTYSTLSLKSVAAGDIITTKAEGFRYEVMASGSSDFDLQTAGGVRLKLLPDPNGEYNFDGMAPFKANNGDNLAKINRLFTRAVNIGLGVRQGPTINFSAGQYAFSGTIQLKATTRLVGKYTGFNYARGTDFLFPPSTAGLIVNRFNTIGEVVDFSDPFDAQESEIIGIKFVGQRGSAFDELKSGIWLRARAFVYRCGFLDFAGHGISIMAGSDGNPYQGNANGFIVRHCFIDNNRGDGVRIQGTDANAGWCEMMNVTRNGGWGVYEGSFLNNFHAGHHSESNASGAYFCNNQSPLHAVYAEMGFGDNIQWRGPVYSPRADNFAAFNDVQGPVLFNDVGNGPKSLGNARGGFRANTPVHTADLGSEPQSIISSRHSITGISYPFRIAWNTDATGAYMRWGESALNLINFGNNITTATYGRSAAVGEHINFPSFFLGGGNNARNMTYGTAPPTTGARGRGDIVWNSNVSSGQPMGWGCSVAGTPGTWIAGPNWP